VFEVQGQAQADTAVAPATIRQAGARQPRRTSGQLLAQLVDDARFPMLTAAISDGAFEPPPVDAEADLEEDFQFGLNLILDGVAALIRSRA
jgi:hypothetical protein